MAVCFNCLSDITMKARRVSHKSSEGFLFSDTDRRSKVSSDELCDLMSGRLFNSRPWRLLRTRGAEGSEHCIAPM